MPVTYLYPNQVTLDEGWTPNTGNEWQCVDDTQGANDGDTTHIESNTSVQARIIRFRFTPMVAAVSVQNVKLFMVSRDNGGGTYRHIPNIITDGFTTSLTGRTLTASYAVYTSGDSGGTWEWALNPNGSVPWTEAALNNIEAQIQQELNALGVGRCTSFYLEVTYTPVSGDLGPVRERATKRLLAIRRPAQDVSIAVPLVGLDNDLMDDVGLSHPELPHPQAPVFGIEAWQQHLVQIRRIDIRPGPDSTLVRYSGRSRRELMLLFWETFEANRASLAEDGNARLTTGAATTMARASDLWGPDPSSGLIVRYGANAKALVRDGMLMEPAATNYVRRSSFKSGTTGWSSAGGGGLGGTIVAEAPSTPLFDSSVTANWLKITHGDASAAHTINTPEIPSPGNVSGKHRLNVDHMDDSGATLTWRLRRTSDTFFWNESTGLWQAGTVDNSFSVRTVLTRDSSRVIDFGAATAFNLTFRQLSGGAAGRVNYIAHCELVDYIGISSRIVTDAAIQARAAATYKVAHSTTKRVLVPARGTWRGFVRSDFSSADATGTIVVWELVFDASNWFRLQFNVGAGNLEFQIRQSGTTTTATLSHSFAVDVEYYLACRWTSAAGELGLAARTHSIFVGGVKGTDATRSGDPSETTADCYLGGSSAGGGGFRIRRWRFDQTALTDEEIQAAGIAGAP